MSRLAPIAALVSALFVPTLASASAMSAPEPTTGRYDAVGRLETRTLPTGVVSTWT